jgi:LAS superfamily LD-carboxypeptidase LdcB
MTPSQLTGRSAEHIVDVLEPRCQLHAGAQHAFLDLHRAARAAGLELAPASSFRSFTRQLTLWNEKFAGRRAVVDEDGRRVDVLALNDEQRIDAILKFSALPGTSRHHWGTDVDLFDRLAMPPGYQLQLVSAEYASGGPFEKLHDWLERHARSFGFFKPYQGIASAVAAEPWHWSFADIAEPARLQLTPDILAEALRDSPILGKQSLFARLPDLHAAFVWNIDPPPALA